MPRRIGKISQEEDDRLRKLAASAMELSQKRVIDVTRDLKFSSGAVSGWLNGGVDRLSLEKKNILLDYLGIEDGSLKKDIVHVWDTTNDALINNLFVFLDKSKTISQFLHITNGCYGLFITDGVAKIIAKPKSKALGCSSLANHLFEKTPGIIYLKDVTDIFDYARNYDNSAIDNLNKYAMAEELDNELSEFIRDIKGLIKSGKDIERIRQVLGINKHE